MSKFIQKNRGRARAMFGPRLSRTRESTFPTSRPSAKSSSCFTNDPRGSRSSMRFRGRPREKSIPTACRDTDALAARASSKDVHQVIVGNWQLDTVDGGNLSLDGG